MKAFWNWIAGWATTLEIRFRHPDLYRHLVNAINSGDDDFTEVGPPDEYHWTPEEEQK